CDEREPLRGGPQRKITDLGDKERKLAEREPLALRPARIVDAAERARDDPSSISERRAAVAFVVRFDPRRCRGAQIGGLASRCVAQAKLEVGARETAELGDWRTVAALILHPRPFGAGESR